jgi:NADPH-dependent 2,4-dienoyl-CoA reductase/sulfur reductase-like enzyme
MSLLPSIRAAYAKSLLYENLKARYNTKYGRNADGPVELPVKKIPMPDDLKDGPKEGGDGADFQGRICIIGAGVTGLTITMLLLEIGITDFDILESSDRVGGRVYTYDFPPDPNCPHNYYDIGAMRIPQIPTMER